MSRPSLPLLSPTVPFLSSSPTDSKRQTCLRHEWAVVGRRLSASVVQTDTFNHRQATRAQPTTPLLHSFSTTTHPLPFFSLPPSLSHSPLPLSLGHQLAPKKFCVPQTPGLNNSHTANRSESAFCEFCMRVFLCVHPMARVLLHRLTGFGLNIRESKRSARSHGSTDVSGCNVYVNNIRVTDSGLFGVSLSLRLNYISNGTCVQRNWGTKELRSFTPHFFQIMRSTHLSVQKCFITKVKQIFFPPAICSLYYATSFMTLVS